MGDKKKESSSTKRKRPCTTCGEKHLPPRGARCTNFPILDDPWDGEEDGDAESAGWATEPYSNGSPSHHNKSAPRPGDLRKFHDDLLQAPLRPIPQSWPPLQAGFGGTKLTKADDINRLAPHWEKPGLRPPSPPPPSRQRDPMQSQVNFLQQKMEEMSAHHKDSMEKISNIERIITK